MRKVAGEQTAFPVRRQFDLTLESLQLGARLFFAGVQP
jgi:hypothetical protein